MMDRSHYIAVAALDFGTTYSGYAFSLRSDFETDPLNIHVSKYWEYGARLLMSHKVPTCVLLDENKELHSFGYDEENAFVDLSLHNKEDEYHFFREFFTEKNFSMDMVLKDDTDTSRSVLAHQVFKMFIKAFVKHLMDYLDKIRPDLTKDYIKWVIPVSEDLTDTGKQFLRSCTEEAGITSDHLMFVTKTEAAFMYCHQLPNRDGFQRLKDGTEYMLVHLGGCGAYITILKKNTNEVIEKHRTICKDCGGRSVNNSFWEFLVRIFGLPMMRSLKVSKLTSLCLMREFETIKRRVKEKEEGKIKMEIPYDDLDANTKHFLKKELDVVFFDSEYGYAIAVRNRDIFINADVIHKLFNPTIDKIINLMKQVFITYADAHKVDDIVMVGGFSECTLVQVAVRQKFSNKNIIIPENVELEVMKGAVLCGHQPCKHMQISSSKLLHVYEKLPKQKGFLLLINFKFSDELERKGSQEDVWKLFQFFSELDYDIDYRSDLTTEELKICIENVKHNILTRESQKYHCFICVIMSHGNQCGISTKDGMIKIEELIRPFKNDSAFSFIGKPKIFMVQACRGGEVQVKHKYVEPNTHVDANNSDGVRMPTDADIIKIYATTPGYVSYRRVDSTSWSGAWFIQAFITAARKHIKNHLLEILTAVTHELANSPEYELNGEKCQLSMSEVALTKLFYF